MKHLPFLTACLANDAYTSRTAASGDRVTGGVIASHRISMPPLASDPDRSWFVDDFYVAVPDLWPTVGRDLLSSVIEAACSAEQERLIVVTSQRDLVKRTMLIDQGFESGAAWWVRTVEDAGDGIGPEGKDIPAVIAPAPPVYDPGGLVALALTMSQPGEIQTFEQQAIAAKAILTVVPCRNTDHELQQALRNREYQVSSEWLVRTI